MLRITVREERGRATLKLEGNLSGPWVNELERCWQETMFCPEHIIIDLSGVQRFDSRAKSLLRDLHIAGSELKGEGPLTSYIVEEIRQTSAKSAGVL
jgi:ABC-type transporter Mla MlaB component